MQVLVDIPEVIASGRSADAVAAEVLRLAVLEAFRRGDVSSGRAAQLLGLSRVTFLETAAAHGVATMNVTSEEFARELAEIAEHR